jgi:hypothetical protein
MTHKIAANPTPRGRNDSLDPTPTTLPLDNIPIEGKVRAVMKRFAILLIGLLLPLAVHADTLPSRDPGVVVPQLQAWHEHGSFASIVRILGKPDGEVISGFSITTFHLKDGTSIYVRSAPSHNRVFGISRSAPGALAETLYEPLDGDLDHPLAASAPF